MILTTEQLDDIFGWEVTADSFFSDGVHIILDGTAYRLIESCGHDLVFEEAPGQEERAYSDYEFFLSRV